MAAGIQLTVITSCTGDKAFDIPQQLTIDDFRSPQRLRRRELELADYALAAGSMYPATSTRTRWRAFARFVNVSGLRR